MDNKQYVYTSGEETKLLRKVVFVLGTFRKNAQVAQNLEGCKLAQIKSPEPKPISFRAPVLKETYVEILTLAEILLASENHSWGVQKAKNNEAYAKATSQFRDRESKLHRQIQTGESIELGFNPKTLDESIVEDTLKMEFLPLYCFTRGASKVYAIGMVPFEPSMKFGLVRTIPQSEMTIDPKTELYFFAPNNNKPHQKRKEISEFFK